MIEVKVRRLQVGFLKEARCEGAYFQFSDSADDPDDETGRYCGHVTGNVTRYLIPLVHRMSPHDSVRFSQLIKSHLFFCTQAVFATWPGSDHHLVVGRAFRAGEPGHLLRSILHPAGTPRGRASSRLFSVLVAHVSHGVHRAQRAQILQTDLAGLSQRLSTWN